MIYVVEKKRLNDFKCVRCVKPRDLFMRFGKREPSVDFDSNLEEPIPMNMSKISSIEYLERYDDVQSEIERQKQTVNDSSSEPHAVKRNEVSEES